MEVFVGQIMPYITVVIFLGGVTWRIWRWMIPRIVHTITLSPFPATWTAGITWWIWQIAIFWNALKFDRGVWIGALFLHIGVITVIAGHIMGIWTLGLQFHMIAPQIVSAELSESLSDWLGLTFGLIFMAALLYLLWRRFAIPKVRVISSTSDYLHLVLLLVIAVLGNYMRLDPAFSVHYSEAKVFMKGLIFFSPEAMPDSIFFKWKFFFVQMLMIVFPFSKLMHSFGFFWMRWMVNRPYRNWPSGMPGTKLPSFK